VPMLLSGDEMGRSQGGNNNAYCQDNEIGWIDWGAVDEEMLAFTRALIGLRRSHPVFRRPRFFAGKRVRDEELKDITWVTPEGREMTQGDWTMPFARSLAFILAGQTTAIDPAATGPETDETFMVLMNAFTDTIPFTLPPASLAPAWDVVLDTSKREPMWPGETWNAGNRFPLPAHAVVVLKRRSKVVGADRHRHAP